MKKIAILLVACLLFTAFPAMQGLAEEVTLENGSFETLISGVPNGWTAQSGSFGTEFTIDTEDPVSGKNALQIESGGNAILSQTLALVPGGDYTLSGYIKVDALSAANASAFIKLEFADSEKTLSRSAKCGWERVSHSFTAPDTACDLSVTLCVTGGGTASFDSLTLSYSGKLQNGSLDALQNGYPASWTAYGGWETYVTSVPAYSGQGIKITNETTDKQPYIVQRIDSIVTPATYTVTGMFKCDKSVVSLVKVEIDPVGKDVEYILTGSGDWKAFSFTFTTEPGTEFFRILPRLRSRGTVYFDEIDVQFTEEAKRGHIRVTPQDVFAYSDMEDGAAKVEVFCDFPESGHVVLSVWDGEEKKHTETKPAAETVSFAYSNALLTELGKAYTLRAELLSAKGSVITACEEEIYKYNRPTHLSEEGMFVDHDGNIVKPITAYHISAAEYSRVAEAGVNVVQCKHTSAYPKLIQEALDEADRLGIYVMVPLYASMKPAAHPDNIEKTIACIERFKDHPALYAWMVMDEPQPDYDETYALLKESYKLIRKYDSAHPVYICECVPASFEQSGQCCDILCVDPYPGAKEGDLNIVYAWVQQAIEAVRGEKPVYSLLQAYEYKGYEPSAMELRHMIFQSLFAGAKAIGYYPINDADSTIWNLALYDGAVDFHAKEKEAAFGGLCLHNALQGEKNNIIYAVYGTRITAINKSMNPSTIDMLAPAAGTFLPVCGTSKEINEVDGQLSLTLEGYQCVTYDFSHLVSIKNYNFEKHTDIAVADWQYKVASGDTPQEESLVFTENGEHGTVVQLTRHGYIAQTIGNLKPNTKYRFSFDIKSTAAVGMVKVQGCGSQAGGDPAYGNINTNGQWKRYSIEGITGSSPRKNESSISLDILLRFYGSAAGAVYYDNVAVQEMPGDGNLLTNSSFACGPDGLGGTWSVSGGTAELDTAAFTEKNAIRLKYGTATTNLNYALVPMGTGETIYEFSCKAKLNTAVSDTSTAYIQMYMCPAENAANDSPYITVRKDTKLTDLPVGKWTELSHLIKMPAGYTVFKAVRLRLVGGGDVSFDDVVLRPVTKSKVMFRKADGEYINTFSADVDGVRVNAITDPGESVTAFAGVYKQEGNVKMIVNISEIATATADGDGLANLNFDLTAPADLSDGDYFIKVFIWDGIKSMTIREKYTLLQK